jgi:hypothetical protein
MARAGPQAAAEEVAMIRPKEKPRPPGLLLGRPGRGYVTQNPTARNVLSLRPHCKISSLWHFCKTVPRH